MQISHFPDFLLDETVFSVASRYLDRMQFGSYLTVSKHFFGASTRGGVRDLPSNLDHLVQSLPPNHVYTADNIIDKHTHFPFYSSFLSFERSVALRQNMKVNGTSRYITTGLQKNGALLPRWLRYCPKCVVDDRLTYGECYWHRLHQISGVLICPIHEVLLENSLVNAMHGNTFAKFRSAESSINELSHREIPEGIRANLIQLANNVKWLLEQPTLEEYTNIQRHYSELLTNRGFVTITGKIRYEQLKEAMLDYYGAPLLENLGCDIVQKATWLKRGKRISHPLHHLLLIQFICGSIQELFTQPLYSFNPFGDKPWPCLNPLCSSYKQDVIASYHMTRDASPARPIATFSCPLCGFAYSRSGPDTGDNARFRVGKVSHYGDVWESQLTNYWMNKNISIPKIAQLMQVDRETIRRQASRLNLPFAPHISFRGERPKIYQDFIEEKRDLYRTTWEEEIKRYSTMKINDATHMKGYSWLRRHDPEWLKNHMATGDTASKGKRLFLFRTQLMHERYTSVDADWAEIVRLSAEKLLSKENFPVRITRQSLVAQLSHSVELRNSEHLTNKTEDAFNRLPLTSCALDEMAETFLAFTWRKLRWTVQSYLDEQYTPSYPAFLRRAHICYVISIRPIIKYFARVAFSNLLASVPLNAQIPEIPLEFENTKFNDGTLIEKGNINL